MVPSDFIAGFAIGLGAAAILFGFLLYIFVKCAPDAPGPKWKEK